MLSIARLKRITSQTKSPPGSLGTKSWAKEKKRVPHMLHIIMYYKLCWEISIYNKHPSELYDYTTIIIFLIFSLPKHLVLCPGSDGSNRKKITTEKYGKSFVIIIILFLIKSNENDRKKYHFNKLRTTKSIRVVFASHKHNFCSLPFCINPSKQVLCCIIFH